MPAGNVQDHVAGLVQAAGVVGSHLARRPATLGPGLPHHRRAPRVHTTSGHLAVHPDHDGAVGDCLRQPDQERITDDGGGGEAAETLGSCQSGSHVRGRLAGRMGSRMREGARHDLELARRAEDDRIGYVGPRCRHLGLGPDDHRLRLRCGQPEGDLAARSGRRAELDPDQLEELHVVQIGDPVEPIDQRLDHLGERLDQGDARIGDVVIGPGGAALLHQPLRVVDEILETPVVEIRGGEHDQIPPVGPAVGMVGVAAG